jgi:hypothetical protein
MSSTLFVFENTVKISGNKIICVAAYNRNSPSS